MTERAAFLQSDVERAIRAARKTGAVLILEPRSGRMIFDTSTSPRIEPQLPAPDPEEEPNPWEEGLKDAAP
ncbi:hypothetical protein [Novosphingobium colocasiae]|uniref:Uncharacterized protein n=1 Tax=Novosphingobium colocasiae TaxID=1256513 RepID=A0A918PE83_9SPHN|nr:hypothetical protein [Novosphingobium colocasiae]GGZ02366.1 hypothetical protein GCM10011614_16790 [Novosphingobium colocasiae]